MSHRPTQRPAISLSTLAEKKALGEPVVMVTAYDYPSAQVAEEAGVDVVLVGDSGAMTVLGHPSTVPVTLAELLMLAQAVRRGLSTPLMIGDMPFGSYEASNEEAIRNAQRFIKEAGCDAVKIERGGTSVERARALVGAGIPVMGHVGLTPQTATALGGYRSQGRTAERALDVLHDALALQDAGCFALVFEAIPSALTEAIMPRMEIPVIGIGAGGATDGQVLVFHDLLGIYDGHAARFVKRYANVRDEMIKGVRRSPTRSAPGAIPSPSTATRWPRTRSRGSTSCSRSRPASRSPAGSRSDGPQRAAPLLHRGERGHDRHHGRRAERGRPVRRGKRARVRVRAGLHGCRDHDGARARRGARLPRGARPAGPAGGDYEHNRLNADTNAHAHIRAAIVGPSETVPVRSGHLALGTWQQIVLVDFDDRERERTVVVQVVA